jgi:hypothetical protein
MKVSATDSESANIALHSRRARRRSDAACTNGFESGAASGRASSSAERQEGSQCNVRFASEGFW